ncbi:MAG: magnesium-translocating P-type ATPase [Myxococcaceae bacterium]|nr:magnesium-translocating P-type ATPase [Myxococcaceae bacterium]
MGDPDAPLADLLARLRASPDGLTSTEAVARLVSAGRLAPARSRLREGLTEFARAAASPLMLILLVAGAASAFLGQIGNAVIIGTMVVLSATINFWQTFRSARAVSRLQDRVAPTATVRRDGAWRVVPRWQVVEGDVVRLSAGDLVPADARLLEATDLHVQQAALTGESLPAAKRAIRDRLESAGPDAEGLVFLGTSVVGGSATAVVYAAGRHTAFGDIVERLSARPEETEFERGARRFGLLILKTTVFLVLFILVVNVTVGRNPLESLLFSVALAVGLTPEFLPMITTVTLAQGAIRMAREKVIVKHLPSIQNLGSIDVLCSDKTGTLTAGTVSLDASIDPFGQPSRRALTLGALNAQFESGIRSPFDAAILACPRLPPITGCMKIGEVPFDFERRRLSVAVEAHGETLFVTKGAPESVMAICASYERADGTIAPLMGEAAERCEREAAALSERGLRVLAVAWKRVPAVRSFSADDERGLTLAGFLTFSDHLLEGVGESIEALRRDGVEVKILSGDDPRVTRHVCRKVGIDADRVVTGDELRRMNDLALSRVLQKVRVFARLSPGQKQRIIHALRSGGHVVGFLGDGINDAPSLHGADVGISVAGAVDVAREASDILLLERRLDVLHAGILAGRRAFGNVFKYLLMGTSSNFGNMFSMAGAALFLPFLPMLPTQILLNNLLYDVAQLTLPTDNVDPRLVARPHRWDISAIRRFMLAVGPVSSVFDVLTFWVLLRVFDFGASSFQTGWFVESLATQVLVLFVIRTAGRPWTNRPSLPLVASALSMVALGVCLPWTPFARWLGFVPLPGSYLAFVAVVVPVYLAFVELLKGRLLRSALEGRPRRA